MIFLFIRHTQLMMNWLQVNHYRLWRSASLCVCPYCSIKGRAASGPSGDISGFPFGFPFAMDVDSPLNLCLGVHPPSKATAVTTTPTTNLIEHLAMSSRGSNCRSFKNASSLRHYFSSRIAVSSPCVRVHRPLPSRQTTLNAWFYKSRVKSTPFVPTSQPKKLKQVKISMLFQIV